MRQSDILQWPCDSHCLLREREGSNNPVRPINTVKALNMRVGPSLASWLHATDCKPTSNPINTTRKQAIPAAATAAKSLQLCPILCNGSPPGSPVPGILQARTLEWVAISFSNAWKWKVKVKSLSHVRLLATPWTAAHQAPPSMGFSRQEYWSGVPLPWVFDYSHPCGCEVVSHCGFYFLDG